MAFIWMKSQESFCLKITEGSTVTERSYLGWRKLEMVTGPVWTASTALVTGQTSTITLRPSMSTVEATFVLTVRSSVQITNLWKITKPKTIQTIPTSEVKILTKSTCRGSWRDCKNVDKSGDRWRVEVCEVWEDDQDQTTHQTTCWDTRCRLHQCLSILLKRI